MTIDSATASDVTIRRANMEDVSACAAVCRDAFQSIADLHNFPHDFSSAEEAARMLTFMFCTPGFYCLVAEHAGRIVGSNCMFEADPIACLGPISISPGTQNASVGKRLMKAVLNRANELQKPGVRLVQAAYHSRSLSLYAKLGFVVRETLAIIYGDVPAFSTPGYQVRPATVSDHDACNGLCFAVHGHDRGNELAGALHQGSATVVERAGRITGYTTGIGFFGHSVGETNDDLKALIAAAPTYSGPGFLVPMRNAELFRWCLQSGLRVKYVMTLMSVGMYNEPQGAWIPSVAY